MSRQLEAALTSRPHLQKHDMRLAWTTDIHLNFVDAETRRRFLNELDQDADAVVITGDIGESHDVCRYLTEIEQALKRPIYFVLGNHDFYRSSIVRTRNAVSQLADESECLVYLTASDIVELTQRTALIGHDGWSDSRLGDFANSDVVLTDYALIAELQHLHGAFLDKELLGEVLRSLGDESATNLSPKLQRATDRYDEVIVATHVPPFREATWHEGRHSDDNWLPHFSCKAVGNVLIEAAEQRPACQQLVLCGHTHGAGETDMLPNLRVLTGGAVYGKPTVQRVFDVQ